MIKGFERSTASVLTKPILIKSYPITLGATIGVPNVVNAPIINIPKITFFLPNISYKNPAIKQIGIVTNSA